MSEASNSDLWYTPVSLFEPLNREFGFSLDGAADGANALCRRYYGPGNGPGRFGQGAESLGPDGLTARWSGEKVWLNCPYGREVGNWVIKAYREVFLLPDPAELAVLLLPAHTGPAWFHSAIWDKDIHGPRRGVQVRFLQGRIKFEGPHNPDREPARFDSMVVVMRRDGK